MTGVVGGIWKVSRDLWVALGDLRSVLVEHLGGILGDSEWFQKAPGSLSGAPGGLKGASGRLRSVPVRFWDSSYN